MKTSEMWIALVCAACLLTGTAVGGEPTGKDSEKSPLPVTEAVGRVQSARSEPEAVESVKSALASRDELVRQLLPIIQIENAQKYSDLARAAAATILGHPRAPEAAGPLVDALTAEPLQSCEVAIIGEPFRIP